MAWPGFEPAIPGFAVRLAPEYKYRISYWNYDTVRLKYSFYTIRNETKTKTDKHRGAICINVLIANYSEAVNSIMYHKKKRSLKNIN